LTCLLSQALTLLKLPVLANGLGEKYEYLWIVLLLLLSYPELSNLLPDWSRDALLFLALSSDNLFLSISNLEFWTNHNYEITNAYFSLLILSFSFSGFCLAFNSASIFALSSLNNFLVVSSTGWPPGWYLDKLEYEGDLEMSKLFACFVSSANLQSDYYLSFSLTLHHLLCLSSASLCFLLASSTTLLVLSSSMESLDHAFLLMDS